jgi:hypothetical protein
MSNTITQARWVRRLRWLHRKIAIFLFTFFLVIATTGFLQSGLLAATQKGVSTDLAAWLSIDSLKKNAVRYLRDSVDAGLSPELDRIDIRPDRGVIKFTFKNHFKGLQLDGATGRLLSVETRKSDFIEKIHDGSMLDKIFGSGGDQIKLGYTITMAISLFMLVLSGLWIWYGPKRIRMKKQKMP